ncbi:MAG TPA: arginase [Micromonosporaceae bacterium]|nr:arginase [Micromonosporaceae bacterium]HCU49797.1 arginase [Micromonosporaceae bacterium]
MRRLAVLDAPSNLGLRPPSPGTVPGCYKLAGALRDAGFVTALKAEDAGYVTPPRYDRHEWQLGDGVFNAEGIATYTVKLADRIGKLLDSERFPVVLGGDCSILLGAMLELRRRGRFGVAYLDGHADLRHPGNDSVGAAAGEGLALITGRGQADLTDLEGLRPYVRDTDLAVIGIRDDDVYIPEMAELDLAVWAEGRLRAEGIDPALSMLETQELQGFWIHLDVDILSPKVMPAVDSPDPGGLSYDELIPALTKLLASPKCVGINVAIFDPDLDPDGHLAKELTDNLINAIAQSHPAL